MPSDPSASAGKASANGGIPKPSEPKPPSIKQEPAGDDDASSWNVVVAKRPHASNASQNSANKSRQQQQQQNYHRPKSGPPQQPNNKPRKPKQEFPQLRSKTSNQAKDRPSSKVNQQQQEHKHSSNQNPKKKAKPKPSSMTIGDKIPKSKKKSLHKVGKQNVSQQQQQKQQKQPPKTKQEQTPTQKPRPAAQQSKPATAPATTSSQSIALDNNNFPALGSSGPASSAPVMPASATASKKGWGVVPKPPPPPPSAAFRSEASASGKSGARDPRPETSQRSSAPAPAAGPKLSWAPPSQTPKGQSHAPKSSRTAATTKPPTQQPTRLLKRGEAPPPTKKKKPKASTPNNGHAAVVTPTEKSLSVASFFRPRPREVPSPSDAVNAFPGGTGRELRGEEHQLLRLVQERSVYQKKGRQRVAPRKKKFTALKKKVLQERLDQWRALHPEETDASDNNNNGGGEGTSSRATSNNNRSNEHAGISPTRSLCIYNYAEPDELEDDDEYEEILDNLRAMATKIGPVEEVLVPRDKIESKSNDNDRPYKHPVFVMFQTESDASAALACWRDWVIGGSTLEACGLIVPDGPSSWSERALVAESRLGTESETVLASENSSGTMDILLQKVLTKEDYEDEDCMRESLEDLKNIANRFGTVGDIRAEGSNGDVTVTYNHTSQSQAQSIAEDLCRVVVGGQPLYASVQAPSTPLSGGVMTPSMTSTLLLENVLTEDDLEDSDCLQESLNDIKELCERYGGVSDVVAKGSAVKVTYRDEGDNSNTVAKIAAQKLDGIILGGSTVTASVLITSDGDNNPLDYSIDLHNFITEDDLEDSDCMEESLSDVRKLAAKHGEVVEVIVCKSGDISSNDPSNNYVRIRYGGNDPSVVAKALDGFGGMVIGGQIISASRSASGSAPESSEMSSGGKRKPTSTPQNTTASGTLEVKKARTDEKAPLYSGDKLIPERFAAMKRVPKIPNTQGPRAYTAGSPTDERIKPLLSEMLGELMRLQKRAIQEKNAKARRRMVMGLREVARGIRSHKVKMVVMANNLDQYGAIDEKLQEIIDLAKSESVPIFFEFTKRSLGKAIGKSIKIAVVGIQNADGAYQPFKKLNAIAGRM